MNVKRRENILYQPCCFSITPSFDIVLSAIAVVIKQRNYVSQIQQPSKLVDYVNVW
jgi:hypothetical protein